MAFISTSVSEGGESDKTNKSMRDAFGPQMVDQMIGQAISSCWMLLPRERRNVQNVRAEMRRILDRALNSFEEDTKAFGMES
jgi:hypothetical protein